MQQRLDDPDPAEAAKPDRPEDYGALLALFDDASRGLLGALATTPDSTAVWTWAEDQTVGFIRRRQAHEALIHRLDAELVVGELTASTPIWPPTASTRHSRSCTAATHRGGR